MLPSALFREQQFACWSRYHVSGSWQQLLAGTGERGQLSDQPVQTHHDPGLRDPSALAAQDCSTALQQVDGHRQGLQEGEGIPGLEPMT